MGTVKRAKGQTRVQFTLAIDWKAVCDRLVDHDQLVGHPCTRPGVGNPRHLSTPCSVGEVSLFKTLALCRVIFI